eukprot:6583530-Pyramimonas_sp.AAC.1
MNTHPSTKQDTHQPRAGTLVPQDPRGKTGHLRHVAREGAAHALDPVDQLGQAGRTHHAAGVLARGHKRARRL